MSGLLVRTVFHQFDQSACSQSFRTQANKLFRIIKGRNASRCLDFDVLPYMGFHQLHIRKRRSLSRKSSGRLDVFCAGFRNNLAHFDFFFLSQQTVLNDYFQDPAIARFVDSADLILDFLVLSVF